MFDRRIREVIPTYELNDYSGEIITGTYYESELQKKSKVGYRISVRWVGWPDIYNSWIHAENVEDLM